MADDDGKFKEGNPGRPPGTKNVRTRNIEEIMEAHDFDPAEARIQYRKLLIEKAEAFEKDADRGYMINVQRGITKLSDKQIQKHRDRALGFRREADQVAAGLIDFRHPKKSSVKVDGQVGLTWAEMAEQEAEDNGA
jgi:hypothetical protein